MLVGLYLHLFQVILPELLSRQKALIAVQGAMGGY